MLETRGFLFFKKITVLFDFIQMNSYCWVRRNVGCIFRWICLCKDL